MIHMSRDVGGASDWVSCIACYLISATDTVTSSIDMSSDYTVVSHRTQQRQRIRFGNTENG